ncbi:FGGY-family carbohydrate kinase [Steroidobacter agaridevorans]|uniref:FGGY-family carbohydrate kinase n=1 Tax=Steroidobacter agaridevorans TaxID=2695856 RepID=UPI001323DCEA|nr:FGGY family carbohydrate kinase [Steroidobacter agaridevorans]GFE91119.1 carbohydrate kinase [Steroidobacter agaridevorans]
MTHPLIALIDIGKTNAKVSVIDPQTGTEIRGSRRANAVVQGPAMRELDVEAISRWLLDALRDAPHRDRIRTIVPVAHGAAAALIDRDNRVVAAPDYEDACFERVNAEYGQQRDAYQSTYSPDLPLGLNLGRQLFFLQEAQPQLFSRVAHALLYPQFWAWRLSGVMASEVTSLGCHSDLWLPREQHFSKLAQVRSWDKLFPPKKLASDVLGPISAEIAAATGLDPQCQVTSGIHDSNASYLKFLIARDREEPFTVISSGTWTVVMANRADLSRLREDKDMLASVDAFGSPVATARFMGGREYEAIAGTDVRPNMPALLNVIERQSMALPAFASGGPFAGREGRVINAESLSGSERASLATLYIALMSELLIEMLGADGAVLIDGPLATNPLFGSILGALLPERSIELSSGDGGNTRAACYLARFHDAPPSPMTPATAASLKGLPAYREAWRKLLVS